MGYKRDLAKANSEYLPNNEQSEKRALDKQTKSQKIRKLEFVSES